MKTRTRFHLSWLRVLLIVGLLLAMAGTAFAAVWTDQADYSPGSVVTISGDNSNGAEYADGETVIVDVSGPNGYTAQCAAQVAGDPEIAGDESWACQVTLNNDASAFGGYSYTATGQTSGVKERGDFTDSPKVVSVTLTPTTRSGLAGFTASFDVAVQGQANSQDNWEACLSLTFADPPPADVTVSFTPNQLAFVKNGADLLHSNLQIMTSNTTASGTYPFTVLASRCDVPNPHDNDSATASGTLVVYAPPQVSKDATTSLTRTWNWTIDKFAAPDTLDMFRGDSGDVQYTVSVVKTDYADSNWAVTGNITVYNPNELPITINSVTDAVSGVGAATVNNCTIGANAVSWPTSLAGKGTLTCTYSAGLPNGDARTNTATANASIHEDGSDGANYSKTIDFDFINATINVNNATIHVTDPNAPNGGNWEFTDTGSKQYDKTFACDADNGTHGNTATITESNPVDQSASASVAVNCYALDAAKSANTSFTRTYAWTINKSADKSTLALVTGQTATVNYSVQVGASYVDSGWKVTGNIVVTNPAPMDAALTSVTDLLSGNINATVDCPSLIVPKNGGTLTCTYSANLSDASTRTNTATATLQNTPSGTTDFTGTASVDFSNATVNEVDECVAVTDTYSGGPQNVQVCYSDLTNQSKTFTYARTIGPYTTPGTYTVNNTARFVTNDSGRTGSSSWTVTVTVVPASAVTNSSLCTFDVDSGTPGNQFRLIYTPDTASSAKLNASNPGQYYYNVFVPGIPGQTVTINLTLPYPFVTQGAMPVHAYSGVTVNTNDGVTCFVPSGEFFANGSALTLGSYNPQQFGSTKTLTFNVTVPVSGIVYLNVHLDYGLKGTTGYTQGANSDAVRAGTTTVLIPNLKSYGFSFTDTVSHSTSVQSMNVFKKDPGVAGLTLKGASGDPVANVKVQIYDGSNKLLTTAYSDVDGFYQWQYKYTGKAATFNVKLPAYNKSQTVTLKSNGFLLVDFKDLP